MRYCLALDLKDDPALIAEYERQHEQSRPEIADSIRSAGINDMQIFRVSNRLFMIIETDDDFSFETKAAMDAANPAVQEWEAFVSTLQQPLPFAKPGEKWVPMKQIFALQ